MFRPSGHGTASAPQARCKGANLAGVECICRLHEHLRCKAFFHPCCSASLRGKATCVILDWVLGAGVRRTSAAANWGARFSDGETRGTNPFGASPQPTSTTDDRHIIVMESKETTEKNENPLDDTGLRIPAWAKNEFRFSFFATSCDASPSCRVGLSHISRWRTSLERVFGEPTSPLFFQRPSAHEFESHLSADDIVRRRELVQQLDAKAYECAEFSKQQKMSKDKAKTGGKVRDQLPAPIMTTQARAFLIRPELFSHACHRGAVIVRLKDRQATIFTGGNGSHEDFKRKKLAAGHRISHQTSVSLTIVLDTRDAYEAVISKAHALGYNFMVEIDCYVRPGNVIGEPATASPFCLPT